MSVACVIPARFSSSRFPGKLLKKAEGKTVLQRTFECAQECPDLDVIYVATDDERIAQHVEEFGGKVIWTSGDCPNGTARIGEAIEKCAELRKVELVVNLQGDHPCTKPGTISAIIEALKEDAGATVSTAVTKIKRMKDFLSPHIVKCVFDGALNALYFSRSPIPYHFKDSLLNAYAHIGIYCYRRDYLKFFLAQKEGFLQKSEDLEQLKVLENRNRIRIAVVEEPILGIDTPKDLKKLKELLCQLNTSL